MLDHLCGGGIWVGVIPLAGCSIISGKPHMMPERMPGEVNSVLQRFSEGKSQ